MNFLGIHIARQRLNVLGLGRWLRVKKMYQMGDKIRGHLARG